MTEEKVLFVDDDSNLLAALNRRLRKTFDLELAVGPSQGLMLLEQSGPFAVVVADMRMPEMDGVEFLRRVKEIAPDTVRIMLTGNADMQTAIDAVNRGNIFRFLTKPCPYDTMTMAVQAGIEQYRLVTAERELLEKTLMGSIKVLADMLSLASPLAFSRATRIRSYVRHIRHELKLTNGWQYEIAGLLSEIGCITLPTDLLERVYAQAPLPTAEKEMFESHPQIGSKLLGNIPRLQTVARMIAAQRKPFKVFPPEEQMTDEARTIALGAQILKIVLDFDQLVASGVPHREALAVLRARRDDYNNKIVTALETMRFEKIGQIVKVVRVRDLSIGMIAHEDIEAVNGLLLVPKGQEITYPVLERLRNFSKRVGVVEPFRVMIQQEGGK
ncbi:MAG TPA: response regulator [Anaerolineae bacterium]|nr:response regulator [Anaerolineae bacterium]